MKIPTDENDTTLNKLSNERKLKMTAGFFMKIPGAGSLMKRTTVGFFMKRPGAGSL